MSTSTERTDRDLLRAYADSSDMESLGLFFGRHESSLLRFSVRLLGDHDLAQDVVQETFLKVASQPSKLLAVECQQNWLLRVARNVGISLLRQRSRARKHAERSSDIARDTLEARDAHARPAAGVESQEARARVRGEIAKLPPLQREVLILKMEQSKSYKEIAEITGLTATYVGYLLHVAMKELTRRLSPQREELL